MKEEPLHVRVDRTGYIMNELDAERGDVKMYKDGESYVGYHSVLLEDLLDETFVPENLLYRANVEALRPFVHLLEKGYVVDVHLKWDLCRFEPLNVRVLSTNVRPPKAPYVPGGECTGCGRKTTHLNRVVMSIMGDRFREYELCSACEHRLHHSPYA